MNRIEFIKTYGFACIGGGLLAGILDSCSPSKIITANMEGNDLIIPIKHFESQGSSATKYVIAKTNKLQFPICVYQIDEKNYSALLMRCSHKGTELEINGNKLQCPAHGSEFTNAGKVTQGPADKNLKTYPVSIVNDQLRVALN